MYKFFWPFRRYLRSINGLGAKSVDCIRLLSLRHRAFPVSYHFRIIVAVMHLKPKRKMWQIPPILGWYKCSSHSDKARMGRTSTFSWFSRVPFGEHVTSSSLSSCSMHTSTDLHIETSTFLINFLCPFKGILPCMTFKSILSPYCARFLQKKCKISSLLSFYLLLW